MRRATRGVPHRSTPLAGARESRLIAQYVSGIGDGTASPTVLLGTGDRSAVLGWIRMDVHVT